MTLHPALEKLNSFLMDENKTHSMENISKYCSSLPKPEKELFTKKIKENVSKEELISILQSMKNGNFSDVLLGDKKTSKSKPTVYKKGDVLMHPIFKHPYILLEEKEGYWNCALITSEEKCLEILEQCRSRFFSDNYITRVIFTTVTPTGNFMYPYENIRHVNSITKKLKEIFKLSIWYGW